MTERRSTHFRDGISRIDFVLVQSKTKSEALRLQNYRFVANLKKIGLRVERERGVKYRDYIFIKLHTPDSVLKRIADIQGVALTYEKDRTIPHYDNTWRLFRTPITRKPNLQDPMFIRCSETVRGEPNTTFTTAERILLTHFVLLRTKFGTLPDEYGLLNLLANKNIEDAYPLHDGKWEWDNTGSLNDRQILGKFWGNWRYIHKEQPMHVIYKYYGPEIAFHYAWLGLYTRLLLPVGIVGALLCMHGIISMTVFHHEALRIEEICGSNMDMCPPCVNPVCLPQKLGKFCTEAKLTYILDNFGTIVFAICITVWATIFLRVWHREETKLLFRWNLFNLAPDIDELPDFKERTKKYVRMNKQTGLKEQYYPLKLQIRQYSISAIFCIISIICIIITVLLIRATRYFFLYHLYLSGVFPTEFAGLILKSYSGLVSVLVIKLFEPHLTKISKKLTEKEVHRTHHQYLNSYVLKSYIMQFFNTYTVLFYNAFFKNIVYTHPGDHEKYNRIFGMAADICPPSMGCTVSLAIHVFFIMLKGYIVMIITKSKVIPLLLKMVKNRIQMKVPKRDIVWHKEHLPQWELDYELEKPSDMFFLDSFMALILEFGIVVFFIAAMPLLPTLALINNAVELRISSMTLLRRIRRDVPKRVQGLGAWNTVMTTITRLSFIISGCVIAFTSRFVHRVTYGREQGSLRGFVNDTLSEFLVEDFTGSVKENIRQKFPNMTVCYYSGLRNSYNHTNKYAPSDRHHQVMCLEMVTLVAFVHIVFFINHMIRLMIPKMPTVIKEHLAYEDHQRCVKNMQTVNDEIAHVNANQKGT